MVLRGTLSPGPDVDGDPVVVVEEIRLVKPAPAPVAPVAPPVMMPRTGDLIKPRLPIMIVLNGDKVHLEMQPLILHGRTMISIKDLPRLGLAGAFNSRDTILIRDPGLPGNELKLAVGGNRLSSPRGMEELDAPALEYNSAVLVPLRAVMETLGFSVAWDGETYTIDLRQKPTP